MKNISTHLDLSCPATNTLDLTRLGFLASTANRLVHQLTGTPRELALTMKDAACSLAILGGAIVNGRQGSDVIGLNFSTQPSSHRIHARLSRLHPAARAIARLRALSAPAVAPLADLVGDELRNLWATLPPRRKRVA